MDNARGAGLMNKPTLFPIRRSPFSVAAWCAAVALFSLLNVSRASAQTSPWATSGNNIFNTNTGNVGVGTNSPGSLLSVSANASPLPALPAGTLFSIGPSDTATAARIIFDGFAGVPPNFIFRAARGTAAHPSALQLNDYLGAVSTWGYGATGYALGARCQIRFLAAENWTDTATGSYMSFVTTPVGTGAAAEVMRIDPFGNVGIGTTAPGAQLEVEGQVLAKSAPSSLAAYHLWDTSGPVNARRFYFWDSNGEVVARWVNDTNSAVVAESISFLNNGNVGIGTINPGFRLDVAGTANVQGNETVLGNLSVAGNIAAKYQDVAEWVPASQSISVGAVVVLDRSHTNLVMPSAKPYDTSVAGVISASPGLALGEAGAGKVLVATTGRVKVKVDATSAPIAVGDLLVTSDKPGMAMKSQPIDVGGAQIHRPGTLIGKALEPLSKGQGEILVLLALQ
jgi:hypothetical protein